MSFKGKSTPENQRCFYPTLGINDDCLDGGQRVLNHQISSHAYCDVDSTVWRTKLISLAHFSSQTKQDA